jgi:hypothetical protein
MRKVLYCKTIVNKEVEFWESYSTTFSEMDNKGYFHQFVIVAEDIYALIETEDGLIVPIRSDRFKFIDSPEAVDSVFLQLAKDGKL